MDQQARTNALKIPWLTSIPQRWQVVPSKRLFSPSKERAHADDEQLSATQAYGVILQREFERRVGRRVVRIVRHLDKRRHVELDDFVISMRSFQGGLERAWATGCIRSSYVVLRPSADVDVGYFGHLFKSHGYIQALQATSNFIRDGQDLNFGNFCLVDLPAVPLAEQKAIARFLDHANGRTRRYVQAKLKLIKLLEEQKQVIIRRAVTRGVDPNARLKPSGVEWLGDVPDHWQVRRLKTLFFEVNKRSATGAETLLSLRMYRGLVPHKEVSDKPIPPSALVGYKHTRPGQLVMNRMRAAIGIFGVPKQEGLVSPDYAVFDPADAVVPSYYLSLFKTEPICSQFRVASKGLGTGSSGFMRLYTGEFGKLWVPVPPRDEQVGILRAIELESAELESAIDSARREVDLSREYRTRLVTDVVIGQLDVREAASKLPDTLAEQADIDIDDDDDDGGMET